MTNGFRILRPDPRGDAPTGLGPGGRGSRGFTLTEVVIAIALFGFVASAAFGFMMQQTRFYDTGERAQLVQQEARGSVRVIVDEIRRAGAGIHVLTVSDPDIVLPNDGSGSRDAFNAHAIKLVSVNPSVPRVPLARVAGNGKKTRTYVLVPAGADLGGLAVGDGVYIEDSNSGTTQILRVTNILPPAGGRVRIEHVSDALESDFAASSTALWITRETTFRTYTVNGDVRLERRLSGSDPWETLSDSVEDLTFRYFDAEGDEITPTSKTLRRSVRRIEVSVRVELAGSRSNGADDVDFVYRASVSPRNQALGDG